MVLKRHWWLQPAVHGYLSIEFTALVDRAKRATLIDAVLYVPDLGLILISIAAITEVVLKVLFIESRVNFNAND